jgi:hypothetical protein
VAPIQEPSQLLQLLAAVSDHPGAAPHVQDLFPDAVLGS